LEAAGIPWRGYFESMPSAGYTGGDTGGTDPYGGEYYLQHHNPFVYFPAVTSLPDFSSDVVPMTSAAAVASGLNAANAPSFVWVTPNAVDDMHDGPMLPDGDTVPTVGDAWIGNFIGTVQATSWYAAGGQIIIDWDEGAESDTSGFGPASPGDGGHIPTVVVSNALAQHPQQDATSVNTAGVLHSVEKTFGLPYLSDAANSANGNIDSLMTFTAPAVTGVQPNAGPATGGTSVTVTGTGFTGAAVVDFGSHAGSTVSVGAGGTSLTVTAPAQSAGTVDVTVTTPSGTSATSSADLFTYGGTPPPTPTVMGVSPSSGSTGGGTPVTVTGSNFTGATAVHFGTTAATSFSVTNSTTISVSSPPGSGTVDVTVTTPGGTSATSSADRFTYTGATSPSITAVGGFSSKTGTALTTLAVTPAAAGDVLVVFAEAATTGTVSSVTGGGVASWTKAVQFSANGVDTEIWFGKVTTTGSSTVTFAWSSSLSGHSAEYGDQEFSAGLGSSTVWALDKSGTKNNASSTSVALPALTPTGAGELYFGYGEVANTASAGTTAGFTFAATSNGNLAAYDPSVSGAVSPVGAQAPAGVSTAVGVLLVAS
ncbi:MAG TPA: IPT/TIG domain-containing protein, partial [Acidimicrobiales bacterium]|nr:IPT/TIG domain-containing protein [Acidimicrobiales bacterium]